MTIRRNTLIAGLSTITGSLALMITALAQPTPEISPWAELRAKNILAWTAEEQRLGYPNIRLINPVAEIPASATPITLARDPWNDSERWLESMEALHLAGLLVIADGKIRVEHYREGHSASAPWMSFSITKSVVSMLYGIATKDGAIGSLDEKVVDHLTQFADTAYAQVRLRDLLQMSSGIDWNEDYTDPGSDVSRLDDAQEADVLAHLASLPAAYPPGEVFNYNTGETILAGVILAKAVGMSLSDYLSTRIWSPFGMEHNADWALMGPGGSEMGGCCISASLRDYGRLGLFALHNGAVNGRASPMMNDWMTESTSPATTAPYYGYFWWLTGDSDYQASGIFGQAIYVSPSHDLVIAMHGLWPVATDAVLSEQRALLIEDIKRALEQSASD